MLPTDRGPLAVPMNKNLHFLPFCYPLVDDPESLAGVVKAQSVVVRPRCISGISAESAAALATGVAPFTAVFTCVPSASIRKPTRRPVLS